MGPRPSIAPVFLRFALGVTFMWAGLGKIVERYEVPAADVALLEGAGVTLEPTANSEGKATEGGSGKTVQRVHGVTAMLVRGATPGKKADGSESFPIVPARAAAGKTPMLLAWAAAITELGAGLLVLCGLFTRVGAVMLAGVMGTAIWLTEIGPAVQSGNALLGFLPQRPAFDGQAWSGFLWQVCLLMSCLALASLGSGWLALDRALFPPRMASAPRPAAPEGGGA